MKLLSRNTDYAVRAVCFIANSKSEIVTAAELVKKLGIPRPFLRKILQVLNNKGILRSIKGAGGGFKLIRSPDTLHLTDLMEAFQGPFKLNECKFKKNLCPNRRCCALKDRIDSIEKKLYKELKSLTVGSILRGE